MEVPGWTKVHSQQSFEEIYKIKMFWELTLQQPVEPRGLEAPKN